MSLKTLSLGINASEGTGSSNDPHWNNVVLLIKGDGSSGAGPTFTDLSSKSKTITNSGSVSLSGGEAQFGSTSFLFNGTSQALYSTIDTDLTLDGDYTIEYWYYGLSSSVQCVLALGNYVGDQVLFTGVITIYLGRLYNSGSTSNAAWTIGSAPPVGSWTHFAITRESGTTRAFINGTLTASTAVAGSMPTAGRLYIGSGDDPAASLNPQYFFNGYIQEVRVTKDVARYTSNFVAPTDTFPVG